LLGKKEIERERTVEEVDAVQNTRIRLFSLKCSEERLAGYSGRKKERLVVTDLLVLVVCLCQRTCLGW
jgi:hypothetical protein